MTGFWFDFAAMVAGLKASRHGPVCGARTRSGLPCQGIPVLQAPRVLMIGGLPFELPRPGRRRMHGGRSTGPRTPEGRAAIAASNRRRAECRRLHTS